VSDLQGPLTLRRINGMTSASGPGKRRPIFTISTQGKSKQELKDEARQALQEYLAAKDRDTDTDS
jgi:hypothetical protein